MTGAERIADAPAGNWVDRWAPEVLRPYLHLMRADRPIGAWLLLWPGWWSLVLAALASGAQWPDLRLMVLFFLGAFVMRGAGCVYNDIVDRDIDGQVARTRARPIPSGRVSPQKAVVFLVFLALIGLVILLQMNRFAIALGVLSLAIVLVYPFMKRVTYWPQAVLGLAFSWGALLGWAAVFGTLSLPPVLLYLGAIFWVIGYDTIYAHQDREDDALVGLKSTALRFGARTKPWLTVLYALAWGFMMWAGLWAGGGWVFALAMLLPGLHLVWQVVTLDIDDPENCLIRFRANRDYGLLVFLALLLAMIAS